VSESASIGGTIRHEARRHAAPAIREGRIASTPDARGRVYVTVRSLTGDTQRLGPCPGASPILDPGPPLAAIEPARGDRCWIALDEDTMAVVLAWEPT
jgi:hypothetical protein